jgi:hypothetical protein
MRGLGRREELANRVNDVLGLRYDQVHRGGVSPTEVLEDLRRRRTCHRNSDLSIGDIQGKDAVVLQVLRSK